MEEYGRILEKAVKLKQELIELRRNFHQYPEVALKEFRTAKRVKEILDSLGIETRLLVEGAGVRGHLTGAEGGHTIALRADTDALPMQEESDAPYRSKNAGCMHACGHDAHTAMLLGAAMILSEMRAELAGNVAFIFQPAEETGEGAKRMVTEGVLADVDSIFGMHVASALPSGTLGYRAGPFMAAGDFFHARIIGKGGHGGMPHLAVDPIPMTAQFINGLQGIVSRETDPLESTVVSVCSLETGKGAYNVLPDAVDLRGTIRYLNPEFGASLSERVRSILEGVTSSMRGRSEFNLMNRFPPTVNDEGVTAFVVGIAEKLLGKGKTSEMKPLLGSEDFSYYLQEIPGTLVFLGIENKEKGIVYPHHHPKFDLDEDTLPAGAALYAAVAMKYLKS